MMRIALFTSLALFTSAAYAADAPAPSHHNTHAPIEITADSLEVQQEQNVATFTGNVVAVQAEMRLKSDKMIVHYRQKDPNAPKQAKAVSSSTPLGDKQSIEKIEVEGNVFLATPEETASGATGVYDVDNHLLTLNDNIVLTRDKNTLNGDKLTYDLDSGKSVVTGKNGGTETGGKTGRVRAVLVPEDKGTKK